MRLRKLLAMFLTLSMLVSIVPTAPFAKGIGSEPSGESEVPAVVIRTMCSWIRQPL